MTRIQLIHTEIMKEGIIKTEVQKTCYYSIVITYENKSVVRLRYTNRFEAHVDLHTIKKVFITQWINK
jgi:hypothetical protein